MLVNFLFSLVTVHVVWCDVIQPTVRHPMLYFDADDVESLRTKAQTTHLKIARQISEAGKVLKEKPDYYLPPETTAEFNSRWNEVYGNNLCAFAMYCLLNPTDKKAFELVKVFMNRLTSYTTWYVTASATDEVPIGHTLTGFVTTYDFLQHRFGEKARKNYLQKIKKEADNLNEIYIKQRAGWTRQHVHNHAPTLCLSMLLSALVYEPINPEVAAPWKNASTILFEKALYIFSFVTDGTIDEGVAYGSYTTRGTFQYIFLAKRHLGRDHTKNPWLRQQFWFNYATVLPGFQRTVGIADSNHNWFYGPECQLVFLDAFVLRNGWGNWLADHVRENRAKNSPLAPSSSQKWSITHLELVFYDADIPPVKPQSPDDSRLHIFHDWGVVTYGGGEPLGAPASTFLSFKSSALNGETVSNIVENGLESTRVGAVEKGWWHFNPGHEHPDQNSFTFAPNGRYFISESLYGPKHTSLNCALMFSPHVTKDTCEAPWEGQIGECGKWLGYKVFPVPRGRVVTATQDGGMVHIAGEAADAYKSELGLRSVQRSLLLIHPDVLLVVDTIFFKPESKINKIGAYFQNVMEKFQTYQHRDYNGAQVIYPEGSYSFFWFRSDGKPSPPAITSTLSGPQYRAKQIHLVNITYDVTHVAPDDVTRIAYVFHGPGRRIGVAKFDVNNSPLTARLSVYVDDVTHHVEMTSLEATPEQRVAELGFRGYARVTSRGVVRRFGAGAEPEVHRCDVIEGDRASTDVMVRSMMPSCDEAIKEAGKSRVRIAEERKREEEERERKKNTTSTVSLDFFAYNPVPLVACLLLVAMVPYSVVYHRDVRWKKQRRFFLVLFFLLVVWCFIGFKFSCLPPSQVIEDMKTRQSCENDEYDLHKSSVVIVTSLPFSGADLLQLSFANISDFFYLTDGEGLNIPPPRDTFYDTNKFDLCIWPSSTADTSSFMRTAGWFQSLKLEPALLLNNLPADIPSNLHLQQRFRKLKRKGIFALNFLSGFWNTKLSWMRESLGPEMRPILVVRDPRDWIFTLMRQDISEKISYRRRRWVDMFLLQGIKPCAKPAITPHNYDQSKVKRSTHVEQLARVWSISVSEAVNQGRSLQIVRFEDLIRDPVTTFQKLMAVYGVTLSLPEINKISKHIHSGHYTLRAGGPLNSDIINEWRNSMSIDDVRKIEQICGPLMETLMYKYR